MGTFSLFSTSEYHLVVKIWYYFVVFSRVLTNSYPISEVSPELLDSVDYTSKNPIFDNANSMLRPHRDRSYYESRKSQSPGIPASPCLHNFIYSPRPQRCVIVFHRVQRFTPPPILQNRGCGCPAFSPRPLEERIGWFTFPHPEAHYSQSPPPSTTGPMNLQAALDGALFRPLCICLDCEARILNCWRYSAY